MAVPRRYKPIVQHEGAKIDPWARKTYGLSGPTLLAKLLQGESHFDPAAKSYAGARHEGQFIPSTRDELLRETGVDAYGPPSEAVRAARIYLRRGGLTGYNPGGGQGYVNYILGQQVGHVGGGKRSKGRTGPTGTVPETPTQGQQPSMGPPVPESGGEGVAALLTAMRQKPQPAQANLPEPVSSGRRFLAFPQGYQPVQSNPPPEKPGVADLLNVVRTQGPDQMPTSNAPDESMTPAHDEVPVAAPTRHEGLAKGNGKLIGFPFQGTHTLGNWQSDRAVDISLPVGTPVYAPSAGKIVNVKIKKSMAGRFGGSQVTIQGPGNSYFYAHLKDVDVKPGQRVKKGQQVGRSGEANGVPHLHFGQMKGDPRARKR